MVYSRILSSLEKILHERYEISSTIKHRGERGRQREGGLAQFLNENLPEAYGVATGEIIPYKGDLISPQCDIIIYDRLHMPIIGKSELVQQVPIESVYAIIESKSILNSNALDDTLNKFTQISLLPRASIKKKPSKHKLHRPLFTLFGFKLETSPENCLTTIRNFDQGGIFTIVALDSGTSIVVEKEDGEFRYLWIQATDKQQSSYNTLAFFFFNLLEQLQSIELRAISFRDFLTTR